MNKILNKKDWLRNYRWQPMNKIQNHVKEQKVVLIKRWQKQNQQTLSEKYQKTNKKKPQRK